MKLSGKISVLLMTALLLVGVAQCAFAETAHMRRIRLSTALINKMANEQDASALADVIKSGKGVAIFPAVTKAGLGIGGQTGEGLVFLKGSNGRWTGPAFMGLSGASIGFQIGVQSVGLVLVITNQEGLRAFTGGNSFKLGADVAIAAGPIGRDTSAATDGRAKASIYSYSMSKGLFAGISIDGCVINQNRDANKAYWGRDVSAANALKKPATSPKVKNLIAALNNLCKK